MAGIITLTLHVKPNGLMALGEAKCLTPASTDIETSTRESWWGICGTETAPPSSTTSPPHDPSFSSELIVQTALKTTTLLALMSLLKVHILVNYVLFILLHTVYLVLSV